METTFSRTVQSRDRVAGDLKTLASDAEDLLQATADDMSDAGRELRARLSNTLARAKATYADLQEQTVTRAKSAMRSVDQVARDYPYQSIGVAFGLGVLIGVLLPRR